MVAPAPMRVLRREIHRHDASTKQTFLGMQESLDQARNSRENGKMVQSCVKRCCQGSNRCDAQPPTGSSGRKTQGSLDQARNSRENEEMMQYCVKHCYKDPIDAMHSHQQVPRDARRKDHWIRQETAERMKK